MTDCGSKGMCPLCTTTTSPLPCVGVIGTAQLPQHPGLTSIPDANDPVWSNGNTNYIAKLKATDLVYNCQSSEGLGLVDQSGYCITNSEGINNRIMNKNILVVGATKDSSDSFDTFDTSATSTFPIQSLHKVWGDRAGKYNKGVNSRNVYIGENAENVSYIHNGTLKSMSQKVLCMEAHGDLYNGSIPGIMKNPTKPIQDPNCYDPSTRKISRSVEGVCKQDIVTLPSCPNWVEIPVGDNYNKRVGGCGCTRDNFGPGVYNVLCYVPKTTDLSTDGRGYVFAVWPFNYTEVYGKDKDQTPPVATETSQYRNNSDFPCYNECENENNVGQNAAINPKCPGGVDGKGCKGDGDLFSVINHELDLEIPANSPQWGDDWKTKMTWATMNCNTWLNDISDYSTDTGAFYTQVAAHAKSGDFISSEPESSSKKDYHWYTIDWSVGVSGQDDYVAFYFDDPFDPTNTVTVNGEKLPTAPKNEPLHKTRRFIPTRAGRLNFGPWMGWWGFDGNNGGIPNFDTVIVRLAHLSIIPQKTGYDFPQAYDQTGDHCDFADLYSKGAPPTHSKSTQSHSKLWILWIILGIVAAIVIAGLIYWYIRKRKLSSH